MCLHDSLGLTGVPAGGNSSGFVTSYPSIGSECDTDKDIEDKLKHVWWFGKPG